MRNTLQKPLGVSLLELMLLLVVIVTISLMATRYYVTTREASRVAKAADMITKVADASYQWVSLHNGGFDTSINMQALSDGGFLPANYGAANNPWRGDITVSGATGSLVITLTKVPTIACNELVSSLSKYATTTPCGGGTNFIITFASP